MRIAHRPVALDLALLLAAAVLAACSDAAARAPRAVLVHGGRIHTGVPDAAPAEALLAVDGRIVAVGARADVEAAAPAGVERVDLAGATALPGLQDAHGHVENFGAYLEEVDLRGARTFAEAVGRIAARARELPAGAWIRGRGWDQNLWPEKRFPHHAALSRAVPDHPVLVRRVDGHAALANARALALAGLDGPLDPVPDVPGGRVLVDEAGRASGVLVDTAMELVARHVPAPTRADRRRRVLRAQAELLALGLTCVHDMGIDRELVELYRELRAEGLLRLRIVAYLWGNDLAGPEALRGLPLAPDATDLLCVIGAKLMMDGALGSRGAALLAEYADAPGERGHLLLTEAALRERVGWLAAAGLQPATHAIGDRANRLVLDAYELALDTFDGFAAVRPRIEHAQVVAPEDEGRFEALGIVASMQPTHCTSDMPWVPDRLGPERPRGTYAWRRLGGPRGERLAFGSDFPVEHPDPLAGLYAALTRQDAAGEPDGGFWPAERLDAARALAGFTSGAAWACRQEDRRGRLAPGYACDLSVLDVDPLGLDAATARELLDARVVMTVVNGEVVHRSDG